MKVEVKEKNEKDYPKLMKYDNVIIIATSFENNMFTGTVVNINNYWSVGKYARDWSEDFTDFKGSLTLSND